MVGPGFANFGSNAAATPVNVYEHLVRLEGVSKQEVPAGMDQDTLASAAAMVDADYLVRDPRPGDQQEILRFT